MCIVDRRGLADPRIARSYVSADSHWVRRWTAMKGYAHPGGLKPHPHQTRMIPRAKTFAAEEFAGGLTLVQNESKLLTDSERNNYEIPSFSRRENLPGHMAPGAFGKQGP